MVIPFRSKTKQRHEGEYSNNMVTLKTGKYREIIMPMIRILGTVSLGYQIVNKVNHGFIKAFPINKFSENW